METIARLRRSPIRWAATATLVLGLAMIPLWHDAEHACAHDLSGLCLDPDVTFGPGDTLDKGNFPFAESRSSRAGGPAPESSENVRLLGHADPGTGFNADVVAHRGSAYLASWGNLGTQNCPSFGVRVYDLKDPSQPQQVATFADAAGDPAVFGSWTEKVIVRHVETEEFTGDLAAVSFQACRPGGFRGFGVYDVTDPADPEKLALVPRLAGANTAFGSHEIWLDVRDDGAFVYTAVILSELSTSPDGQTPGEPDFQVWDVSDPTTPQKVGEWGAWAELGLRPVRQDEQGTTRVAFVHSVIADGEGTAYLSYWDNGTIILDVSDPTAPEFVGRTDFAPHEEGNAHSAWTARGGRVLIQDDEDFSPGARGVLEAAWGYPRFYDISDPADPRLLSTFELPSTRSTPGPGFFTVHDPKVRGNLVYFSWYAEGVVVVDISQPTRPRKVAQFVPEPAADPRGFFFPGEEFANVWGVFLERDYVLASDINSGLWVFKLDRSGRR